MLPAVSMRRHARGDGRAGIAARIACVGVGTAAVVVLAGVAAGTASFATTPAPLPTPAISASLSPSSSPSPSGTPSGAVIVRIDSPPAANPSVGAKDFLVPLGTLLGAALGFGGAVMGARMAADAQERRVQEEA